MTTEQVAGCKKLHEKYAGKQFTVTEEIDGHCWGIINSSLAVVRHESCLYCMMIRRADGKNTPCKGPQKIVLR